MRCYLHVGTEKTGSSYLQSKLALARQALKQQGLWFPYGAPFDEKCMKNGHISGGNALKLAEDLEGNNWHGIVRRLESFHSEAIVNAAEGVIVSSELLLRPLGRPGVLAQFLGALDRAGFHDLDFLLVLRNPIDQFLSLYKHRAKRGTTADIATWCESGYTLPMELETFRRQAEASGINLTVRGYSRELGVLEQRFFEDWLGLPAPVVDMPLTINPSLTLSELQLLRLLAERRPSLVTPLYDRFLATDPKRKVQGREQEAYARAVAERAVAAHRDEWAQWNVLLPASEHLVIPQPEGELPPEPRELAFSKAQMEAVMGFLAESVEPRFLVKLLWTAKIRPFLASVKRATLMGIRR
jgi:hypothetical protein